MNYSIIRMPKSDEDMAQTLSNFGPFLDAMYTAFDREKHGPQNFMMEHWLFLWDQGACFLLAGHDDKGTLRSLGMCTKFRDMWHGKTRVEIHRYSFADMTDDESKTELVNMGKYLQSVADPLGMAELYIVHRTDCGGEYKELVWQITPVS